MRKSAFVYLWVGESLSAQFALARRTILRRLRLFKEIGMNRGAAIEQVLIGAMLVMLAVSLFAIASGYDFLGLTLFMVVAIAVRLLAAEHARRWRRTATPTGRNS